MLPRKINVALNVICRSSKIRCHIKFVSNIVPKYKILYVPGKGRVALATDCIEAGTEICRQLPLLQIPTEAIDVENVRSFSELTKIQPELVAMLWQYQNLQQLDKDEILTLYCPVVGKKANSVNTVAESWINIAPDIKSLIIQIATIMSFSSYINEQGSRVLYHLTSLMSHSCVPNCVVDTAAVEMTVRCITAVKKGEELTIEYNEDYFDQPTPVRRAHLIQSKEFLCRCPRCVSVGDDTRQFNCFDSACDGRHLATTQAAVVVAVPAAVPVVPVPGSSDDGPHRLLACTKCHRLPPLDYEARMFHKESSYLSEVQLLRERMQVALTLPARSQQQQSQSQQSDTFHQYHFFQYFSTCHSMCVEFAMEQAEFYRTTGGDAARSGRLNAMALACLDSCVSFPHFYTANLCSRLGDHHYYCYYSASHNNNDSDDGAGLQRAREYYQRALRICDIEQRRECMRLKDSLTRKMVALTRTIDRDDAETSIIP